MAHMANPKDPEPSRLRAGCFGLQSHPKRIGMDRDNPGFLGHTVPGSLGKVLN